MNWKQWAKNMLGGAKSSNLRTHKITTSLPPVTPSPRYICENCGMLIKTGHGHTRNECQEYLDDPTNPDSRAHKTILPGRNDPKIRMPYYHEPGTFQNWER